MPFSREVAQQTTLSLLGGRGERSSASAAGTSVGVPHAAHLGPLTGWQRQLALQVIEQLHLTCPVYLQAPSLAEIWSWRAVTQTLAPTLAADEHEQRRVDATDVGGHLWAGESWETDAEHADMEAPDSDPSHSDPDPVVDPRPGSARTAGTRVVLPLATLKELQALLQIVLLSHTPWCSP